MGVGGYLILGPFSRDYGISLVCYFWIWRDFFSSIIYYVSVLSLHIESSESMVYPSKLKFRCTKFHHTLIVCGQLGMCVLAVGHVWYTALPVMSRLTVCR